MSGFAGQPMHTPMGTPIVRGNVYAGAPSANYSPLSAALGTGAVGMGSSYGSDFGGGDSGFGGGFSAPAGFSAPVSAMGTDNGFGMGENGVSGVGIGTGGEATGDSGDGGTGAASSAGGGSGGK
jgi:hypothetical protein